MFYFDELTFESAYWCEISKKKSSVTILLHISNNKKKIRFQLNALCGTIIT